MFTTKTNFLHLFLKKLGVKVPFKSVVSESNKYYSFPDYSSIVKILYTWGVSSDVYQVGTNEISEIHSPFITFYKGDFVLAEHAKGGKICVYYETSSFRVTIDEFCKDFSGFVIIASKPDTLKSPNFKLGQRLQFGSTYYWLAVAIAIVIELIISFSAKNRLMGINTDIMIVTLVALKMIALCVIIILLKYSIDKDDRIANRFCTGSCYTVSSYLEGVLPLGLTWADFGFFYFSGTTFLLVTKPLSTFLINQLLLLNICCLMFSLFSVYFQLRIVKEFCKLCLIVQAIFWLEFGVLIFIVPPYATYISYFGLFDSLLRLCFPGIVWVLIKSIIVRLKEYKSFDSQMREIKYNPRNFNSILNAQEVHLLPPLSQCIYFGDGDINTNIAIVTDPDCAPCSNAMSALFDLIKYRTDIRIFIIFLPFSNEFKSSYVKHVFSLFNEDPRFARQAIVDWYSMKKKDYVSWASNYPVRYLKDITILSDVHRNFCQSSSTKGAPTVFVNGRKLPSGYLAADLKYLL